MDDALERLERHVLERPDLDRRRVGRRVDRGGVDEELRHAPVGLDESERRLERPAVGDVAGMRADAPVLDRGREPGGARPRRGLEVEDRDAHAALGEPGGERRPELAHAAGDDRDAALEVEERVRHGAIVLAVVAGHAAGAPPEYALAGRMGGGLLLVSVVSSRVSRDSGEPGIGRSARGRRDPDGIGGDARRFASGSGRRRRTSSRRTSSRRTSSQACGFWDRRVVPVTHTLERWREPQFGQSVLGVGRLAS